MELHATIHEEEDGTFWAEVKELSGCFASGSSWDELLEVLFEAVEMCLPDEAPAAGTRGRKKDARLVRVDEMKLLTA